MRKFVLALLLVLFSAAPAAALQCVPYARAVSGLSLQGDAWRWWSAAEGVYERGSAPAPGAVLVFKSTKSMRHGHVAVVSRVVGRREIRIDHANWGRGRNRGKVDRDVAVIDVSPRNDWTQVRVWHEESESFGARVNPAFGFIYQPGKGRQTTAPRTAEAKVQAAPVQPAVAQPAQPSAPVQPVVAEAAPAVRTAVLKVPAPKPVPAAAAAPAARPAADDLNARVLARLQAESLEPQQAAMAGERPKVALGDKKPAPKPTGRAVAPTSAKSKISAPKRRS